LGFLRAFFPLFYVLTPKKDALMKSQTVSAFVLAVTLLAAGPLMANEETRDMSALFPQPKPNTTLSQRPEKPELEGPAFYEKISDTKVTLKWKEANGATAYHVQIATDPNFKWLVKEESILKTNTLEVGGLEGGKSYFWRVAGLKLENKSGHVQGVYSASMFETTAK
jgi:hypothetical protein